jgi:glycerol-3-phosphate acyltransferase PlsY
METFLYGLAGYLIGSIPVAYILAKKKQGIDLRNFGSGNIGARNAYEVTGNKRIGFSVLVLDMHKAIIPLVILDKMGKSEMIPVAAVTIILGHCYPVWLKFRGGRGLATAAAIALLLSPVILLLWLILYFLTGVIKSKVHIQAFVATLGVLVIELFGGVSTSFRNGALLWLPDAHIQEALICVLIIILSRHILPVYSVFFSKRYDS